jgi:SAM-dependent methyltransferase
MTLKNNNGEKFESCPVCGSIKIKFKLNTFDRHYMQYHNSYDVYRCSDCGLLFLNPMISEEQLHNLYPKDEYYAYNKISPFKLETQRGIISKIKALIIDNSTQDPHFDDVEQRSVLDVGCGNGEKLGYFKQVGWRKVQGVEIDKHACEIGKTNGIDIFHGTLIEAGFPENSFDYIRSNHSFEHIINNYAVLGEMYRVCKPGGRIFIGVPNTASINFKVFKKYWYFLGIPFHPFGYSPKSLKLLLQNTGFEIDKIRFNGSALGILGSLQILLNTTRGVKHSKGVFINKVFEIPVYQLARLLNFARLGDCIEVVATKPI